MIPPEKWVELLALVRDVRHGQRCYRSSLSPFLKAELPRVEEQLDRLVGELSADPDVAALVAAEQAVRERAAQDVRDRARASITAAAEKGGAH